MVYGHRVAHWHGLLWSFRPPELREHLKTVPTSPQISLKTTTTIY